MRPPESWMISNRLLKKILLKSRTADRLWRIGGAQEPHATGHRPADSKGILLSWTA